MIESDMIARSSWKKIRIGGGFEKAKEQNGLVTKLRKGAE
jgi:hypothetical protein